jgi:hypothetical protein
MSTTGKHFRKRNPMRKKLVESLLEGKRLGVAYKEAGYASIQSAQNALRLVRGELMQALTKQGWDAETIIRKCLIPKLQAKKTLYFQNAGIVTDSRTVGDTSAQLAALDMLLKIIGGYAPLSVEHSGAIVHVLTEAEKREARDTVKRMLEYEDTIEGEVAGEEEQRTESAERPQ